MHMANELISPIVGTAMFAATGGLMTYSARKIPRKNFKESLPLMSVLGALVFAVQMINFTIPGTGSSGHLGGGMLLAILLGPYAGFLTMAAILLTQVLFFADGGLLAYGCNVFNLGFYTCFIAYPLIYKPIMHKGFSKKRLTFAVMLSSLMGLQLGALSVVIETLFSGKAALSFSTFLLTMLPIHLAIGIAEGIIITSLMLFIDKVHSPLLDPASTHAPKFIMKKLIIICALCAMTTGGLFSLFASSNPDGLEWAVSKATGSQHIETTSSLHIKAQNLQENFAILPDYGFKVNETTPPISNYAEALGTSTSGILGSFLTALFVALIGHLYYFLKSFRPFRL